MCRLHHVHEMMSCFQHSTDLHLMPNWAFSAALADYFAFKDELLASGNVSVTATGVHAAGDNPPLDAKLVTALLTFPTALPALAKVLQDQVWRCGVASCSPLPVSVVASNSLHGPLT
jgi:hypothetical protein